MTISEKIIYLIGSLFPKGRAFRFIGNNKRLHEALSVSAVDLYNDSLSVLDSILPDNDNFTKNDATEWEVRLGLITNTNVSLEDRKAAILRKMNYPGTIPARQSYLYLERELRLAGFDVYVFENRWLVGSEWRTQTIGEVSGGVGFGEFQLNDFQLGESQLGGYFNNIVANSIYATEDENFDIGSNSRATFFIGGNKPVYGAVGTFANVNADREIEFRQLILKIKPANTVAYLFIDYI